MLDYLPILASVAWALSALAVWGWVVGPFLVQRMEAPFLIQLLLAASLCAFLVWIRKSRRDKEPIQQSQASSVSPPPSGGTCAVCQTKRDDTLTLSCGSHSVSARCLDALRTRAFVELPEPDACPICRAHLLAQQAFMRAVVSIVRAEARSTDGDSDGGGDDVGEALSALDEALRLDPEHLGALCTQGELLVESDTARAMATLRRALALDESCAEAHMHMARALEAEAQAAAAAAGGETGIWAEAAPHWRRAITEYERTGCKRAPPGSLRAQRWACCVQRRVANSLGLPAATAGGSVAGRCALPHVPSRTGSVSE